MLVWEALKQKPRTTRCLQEWKDKLGDKPGERIEDCIRIGMSSISGYRHMLIQRSKSVPSNRIKRGESNSTVRIQDCDNVPRQMISDSVQFLSLCVKSYLLSWPPELSDMDARRLPLLVALSASATAVSLPQPPCQMRLCMLYWHAHLLSHHKHSDPAYCCRV